MSKGSYGKLDRVLSSFLRIVPLHKHFQSCDTRRALPKLNLATQWALAMNGMQPCISSQARLHLVEILPRTDQPNAAVPSLQLSRIFQSPLQLDVQSL